MRQLEGNMKTVIWIILDVRDMLVEIVNRLWLEAPWWLR